MAVVGTEQKSALHGTYFSTIVVLRVTTIGNHQSRDVVGDAGFGQFFGRCRTDEMVTATVAMIEVPFRVISNQSCCKCSFGTLKSVQSLILALRLAPVPQSVVVPP